MSEFIFVFRGGETPSSPAEMQAQMQKWGGWMADLRAKGHFKVGEPLEKAGKVLKGKKKVLLDGPYAEAKDIVGGFIIVTARDLDHATELGRGCPIFDDESGSVEVRPIRPAAM